MSEPSRLLERIETGFGRDARAGSAASVSALPLDGPPSREVSAQPASGARSALNYASLALLGLIASGLILVVGMTAGFHLFAAAIAAAGVVGALLLAVEAIRAFDSVPVSDEAERDKDWHRSETSALLSTIHDALGDLALRCASSAQATQITFDISGEHRHPGVTEGLDQPLQGHRLAGAGGTGNKTVTVGQAQRLTNRLPITASTQYEL